MNVEAKAIFAYTNTGRTVKNLAGFLPNCPIYAITPNRTIYKQLSLIWGVKSILVGKKESINDMLDDGINIAKEANIIKKGDLIAIAGGASILTGQDANMNKTIGGILKV